MKSNESAFITEGGNIEGYKMETNRKGFREEEFSTEPDNDTYRIAVIGDSQTFGWGVNQSDRYTEILEKEINSYYKREDVQVLNLGIPGYGLKDYHLMLKHRALKYNPDLIIVTFFYQDVTSISNRREIQEKIANETDTEINDTEAINRLEDELEKHIEESPFRQEYDKWLGKMEDEAEDTPIIFYGYHLPDQHLEVASEVADRHNLTFFHLNKHIMIDKYQIPPEDDPHLNEEGHKLLENRLRDFIIEENIITELI